MDDVDDQITIHAPAPGSTPSQRESGFGALDSESRSLSYRNLAAAAYVYAGVYCVAFWSGWFISSRNRAEHLAWPEMHFIVAALPSTIMALAIARAAQKHLFSAVWYPRVAQLFLIFSSLGISANDWSWQFYVFDPGYGGVHWVGVWIVMFAAAITLPPMAMLRASFLASLTIPLILLSSIWILGFPPQTQETGWALTRGLLAEIIVPVWICCGIATVISARVFDLEKGATKARRLGSYRLEEKLGEGGMGEVWRASHRMLARPAAIKLIRKPEGSSESADSAGTLLKRFEREAQATAALTSPHTVQVYDFGIARDGRFYYVMELLRGMDLRTLVEKTGPVPAARALHLLGQACDSLADAHAHGMVHRDIKPANLFICRKGLTFDFLKVLDFGLVKEAHHTDKAAAQLTLQGIASGTPGYMAPEMATEAHALDGRADLYALGCVGFWLLSGNLVFAAESPVAMLLKHVNEAPPSLRGTSEMDVPEVVEELIMSCLAKSPSDRPASAQVLGARIREAQRSVGEWTTEQSSAWWRLHLAELAKDPSSESRTPTPVAAQ